MHCGVGLKAKRLELALVYNASFRVQEREKRGDKWAPRFFKRNPEKEAFANEYSDEQCPFWDFNGEYLKLEPRRATPEGNFYMHPLYAHAHQLIHCLGIWLKGTA